MFEGDVELHHILVEYFPIQYTVWKLIIVHHNLINLHLALFFPKINIFNYKIRTKIKILIQFQKEYLLTKNITF